MDAGTKARLRGLTRAHYAWILAGLHSGRPQPKEEQQLSRAALAVSDEDIRAVEESARAAFEAMREQGLKLAGGEEGKDE